MSDKMPSADIKQESVQELAQEVSHEAGQATVDVENIAPNAEINTLSDTVEKRIPKGVGFMGRRGTAPVHTASEEAANDAPENTDTAIEVVDEEGVAQETQASPTKVLPAPGVGERLFRGLSVIGLPVLIIFWALQVAAGLWYPSLFLSTEIHWLDVYTHMTTAGQWLIPPTTEQLTGALPGYFWFMYAVDLLPLALPEYVSTSFYLPLVAAFATLMLLCAVYILGICVGFGKQISFAAGCILLTCPGFAFFGHMVGADILSAALLCFALAFLYKGWVSESAVLWMITGFLCTALATLTGGLLPLWIILGSSIMFILWRGTLGRAHSIDAVLGFGVLVFSLVLWLMLIILYGGEEAHMLDALITELLLPLQPPFWPPITPWWFGLAVLSVALMPWLFLPFFISWGSVLKKSWASLKASRKERSGGAWLFIVLIIGLVFLVGSSKKAFFLAMPLMPVLALIFAKSLRNLSPRGSRWFYMLVGLLCFMAGFACLIVAIPKAAFLWTPLVPSVLLPALQNIQGLYIVAGVCFVASVLLIKFAQCAYSGGPLLVLTLMCLLLTPVSSIFVAPSLVGDVFVHHPLGMGATGAHVPTTLPLVPEDYENSAVPMQPVAPIPQDNASEMGEEHKENSVDIPKNEDAFKKVDAPTTPS